MCLKASRQCCATSIALRKWLYFSEEIAHGLRFAPLRSGLGAPEIEGSMATESKGNLRKREKALFFI
jgi:hypothetical protein